MGRCDDELPPRCGGRARDTVGHRSTMTPAAGAGIVAQDDLCARTWGHSTNGSPTLVSRPVGRKAPRATVTGGRTESHLSREKPWPTVLLTKSRSSSTAGGHDREPFAGSPPDRLSALAGGCPGRAEEAVRPRRLWRLHGDPLPLERGDRAARAPRHQLLPAAGVRARRSGRDHHRGYGRRPPPEPGVPAALRELLALRRPAWTRRPRRRTSTPRRRPPGSGPRCCGPSEVAGGRAPSPGRAAGEERRRRALGALARRHEPRRARAGRQQRQPVRLLQRRLRDEHVGVPGQPPARRRRTRSRTPSTATSAAAPAIARSSPA